MHVIVFCTVGDNVTADSFCVNCLKGKWTINWCSSSDFPEH